VTNSRLRICLAASAGGHMSQLLKLCECWIDHDTFVVTTTNVAENNLREHGQVYVVGECNRKHPLRVLKVMWKCMRIVRSERPSVVISTGAAPGFSVCISAKMFGAKIVWVDSIANVEKLSMSGRLIRPFADLILSQWPEVAACFNVEYAGAVV
jgi:UDP-N-acetylglucosamine:LPS N-acetylglucosamine transferase